MAIGQERLARLREKGASEEEITAWVNHTSARLREKGASDAEIASYWGQGPLNMAAVDGYVKRQTEQPNAEGAVLPEETARRAKGLIDAFRAGEQQSVTGLTRRGGLPDIAVGDDQNIGLQIASAMGTLAGDLPVVVPSFVVGAKPGAVIGAAAGGAASRNPISATAGGAVGAMMTGTAISSFVTEEIRGTLIKTYRENKGQDVSPRQFSAALMANALSKEVMGNALKAAGIESAGAAVAGPVLGKAITKGAGPVARELTVGGAQMTGAVAAASALEGELPTAQEFGTMAAVAFMAGTVGGGIETVAGRRKSKPNEPSPENTAEILEDIYVDTGKKPGDVMREADGDPLVRDAVVTGADMTRPERLYLEHKPDAPDSGAFNEGDRLNIPEKAIDVDFVDEGDTTWSKYARAGRGVRPPDPPPPPPDSPASFSKGDDPKKSTATQKDVEDVLGSMAATSKRPWMDVDDFRYLTVDDLQYAKSFMRRAYKDATGKPLPMESNPGELMALARGAHARAEQHIARGVFDPVTGEKQHRALKEVYDDLGSRDRKRAFRAYMISKRLLEKRAQGFDVPVSDAHKKIAESGDRSGEVTTYWQEVQGWNNAGLDMLRGTVLSEKGYATIRQQNENFVPLWSADMDFPKGRDTPRGIPVRDPIKKFKGKEFDFVDPFEAMVRNRFFVTQTAMNAQARLRYADFNDGLPVEFRVMDRITPRRLKKGEAPEKDSVDWLWAREVYGEGLTDQSGDSVLPALPDMTKAEREAWAGKMKDLDPERALVVQGDDGGLQIVTIDDLVGGSRELTEMKDAHGMLAEDFTWLHVKPELDRRFGKRNIVVFRDGRPEVYRPRDPRLAYAFEHLTMGEQNQLVKALSIPAQVARAGITSMPTFFIPAMMRDTIDATLINHFKSTPFVTITDGAVRTFLKDSEFAKFVENGGAGGALINMDANILKMGITDFEDNKAAHLHRKAYNVLHSGYGALYAVASATDQFNRVGAMAAASKEGLSPEQAALRGRVMSLDHARAGAAMRAINKIVMFLGPTINGVDRAVLAARNDPVRLTMLATAYLTIPSLLLWAANADEEWYKDLTPQQKGLNWYVRVGGTSTDPVIVPIPKPHTWVTLFSTTPELAMDHIHKTENPDLAKNILEGFAKDFIIDPTEVTATTWATEIASNHSGFLDRPIVPQRLERSALPEYRYTPYTTETAKNLAKLIPDQIPPRFRTPIAIDHMINSLTGTRGQGLVREVERLLGATGVIERTATSRDVWQESTFVRRFLIAEPRYTKTIDDFYANADLARQSLGTYKEMIIQGRTEEANKIREQYGDLMLKADGLERASGEVFAMVRMIEFHKEMKPYEKQQNIDNLMRPMAQAMAIYNEEMRRRKLGVEESE